MPIEDGVYSESDLEAAKILNDFLPPRLFDAHAHPYDWSFIPQSHGSGSCNALRPRAELRDYLEDMGPLLGGRDVGMNMIPMPDISMGDPKTGNLDASVRFTAEQLDKYPGNTGEVLVLPGDTEADIEKRLVHPDIRGFKCYHSMAKRKPTWNASIGEYLPESAWAVADRRGFVITLHMVKDKALSDPENLSYITAMAGRYPNAVLILAHAARSFAAWTGLEAVEKLAPFPNVWFDFAAVCESPAMFQVMKTCGVKRCMWGSDYAVSRLAGKAISLADTFYWIGKNDLERFAGATAFHSWLIATENLMATRQACLMLGASRGEVEDLFCNNALGLFGLK